MASLDNSEIYKSVEDEYAGKSVFITGGTGFLGKVFVEKLLYSCPKIDKIYLLMREKNKNDSLERIKKMLELPIFQRVKNERPADLKKIVSISGDVTLPNLGICDEDRRMLIETVTHVFHFAAIVKFNEPLRVVIDVNVEGTRRVLQLSKLIKNIEVFVYVSTAYSNTDQPILYEIVYPPPSTTNEVYRLIQKECYNEDQVKKLISGRPNTYTFAKALAENVVNEEHEEVPTIIIRPSIVSPSMKDPLVGWVDNWFGATALIATIGKGINRILISKSSNVVDLIPVDYVSNLTIVAAAKCKRSKQVLVYNSCTSAVNPLSMGEIGRLISEDCVKNKYNEFFRPSLWFTQYNWILDISVLIVQIIPAFIVDCFLCLTGKTPRFMKMQRRIKLVRDSLRYFTARTWDMRCDRTRTLFASLSPTDRIQFPFNPTHIIWSKYISIYFEGINKFLRKQKI